MARGVRNQSRMAVTWHEVRGNVREPDGGTACNGWYVVSTQLKHALLARLSDRSAQMCIGSEVDSIRWPGIQMLTCVPIGRLV